MIDAPHLWIPKARIIEPRDPIVTGLQMAGEFRIQAFRPDGRCRLDTGFFRNLITNTGLDAPGAQVTYNSISVGTGNTAPANTNTTLETRLATTSTLQSDSYGQTGTVGDAGWYHWYTRTMRFAQGAAAGNLTEIGVTLGSSPWTCYSRALILDGSGSPTTLTIAADEYLDATYRHRWYVGDLSGYSGSISITGSGSHSIVLRPRELDGGANAWRPDWMWYAAVAQGNASTIAYNGSIGSVTESPSGTSSLSSGNSVASYTTGNYYRDATRVFGLDSGNLSGGISAMSVDLGQGLGNTGGAGSYQFSLSPAIAKTSTKILTMNFRQSWARKSI